MSETDFYIFVPTRNICTYNLQISNMLLYSYSYQALCFPSTKFLFREHWRRPSVCPSDGQTDGRRETHNAAPMKGRVIICISSTPTPSRIGLSLQNTLFSEEILTPSGLLRLTQAFVAQKYVQHWTCLHYAAIQHCHCM